MTLMTQQKSSQFYLFSGEITQNLGIYFHQASSVIVENGRPIAVTLLDIGASMIQNTGHILGGATITLGEGLEFLGSLVDMSGRVTDSKGLKLISKGVSGLAGLVTGVGDQIDAAGENAAHEIIIAREKLNKDIFFELRKLLTDLPQDHELKKTGLALCDYLSGNHLIKKADTENLARQAMAVINSCTTYQTTPTLTNYKNLSSNITTLENETSRSRARCKAIRSGLVTALCVAAVTIAVAVVAASFVTSVATGFGLAAGIALLGLFAMYKLGKAAYQRTYAKNWGDREEKTTAFCESARFFKKPPPPAQSDESENVELDLDYTPLNKV
ncbi:MAG: hypothetical protein ABI370_01485 [Gammaproteobacteria bacterium]